MKSLDEAVPNERSSGRGYAVPPGTAAGIVAATGVCIAFQGQIEVFPSLPFLAVVAVAAWRSLKAGLLALAVTAAALLYFVMPPIHSFVVKDWSSGGQLLLYLAFGGTMTGAISSFRRGNSAIDQLRDKFNLALAGSANESADLEDVASLYRVMMGEFATSGLSLNALALALRTYFSADAFAVWQFEDGRWRPLLSEDIGPEALRIAAGRVASDAGTPPPAGRSDGPAATSAAAGIDAAEPFATSFSWPAADDTRLALYFRNGNIAGVGRRLDAEIRALLRGASIGTAAMASAKGRQSARW